MQLADQTDLLQSESALAAKSIEIRQAEDDLKTVSRAFNSLRGVVSDRVDENLLSSNQDDSAALNPPATAPGRLDVQVAKEMIRVTAAKSQIESDKYKPNLEVFGSYALNGRTDVGPHLSPDPTNKSRDEARLDSVGDTFGNDYPTSVIGVRISAPLGGDTKSRKEQALSLEREAARLAAEQKVYEAQRDWSDLTKRLADAKERLVLAKNLETIQRKKLEHEQTKQKSGRSTTYQVVNFEQDYVSSQLNSIRIKAESFELISRMKTFGIK
jgi:outer membrane protein TolC